MRTSWPKIQKSIIKVVEAINAAKVNDYLEIAIPDLEERNENSQNL